MRTPKTWPALCLVVVLVVVAVLVWSLQSRQQTTPSSPSLHPIQVQVEAVAGPVTATAAPFRFRPTSATLHLQTLEYSYYAVGYDNSRKNPAWVVYELDGPVTYPGAQPDRPAFTTEFRTDADVSSNDYTHSGLDRGHLFPAYAGFSRYGAAGFKETFTMANVIPQPHSVNAGIWEDLESDIAGRASLGAGWAETLGHITVINGPIYSDNPELLRSGVVVPSHCFSVVLDYQELTGGFKALAFKIPNAGKPAGPLSRWLVTIKSIETETGLDLLTGMDAGQRGAIENGKANAIWTGIHP